MRGEGLHIIIKPQLPSNERLKENFKDEIFRRVKRTRKSKTPTFIFFRPQGRPMEEFNENIAALIRGLNTDDIIMVSITNNTEKSDAYLDDTEFAFKLKVKLVLTEGHLDISRNEAAFCRVCKLLMDEYHFKNIADPEEPEDKPTAPEENESSKLIRKRFQELDFSLIFVIVNDDKSEFTNGLLTAIENPDVPYKQQIKAKQFHGYKLGQLWILDYGSAEVRYLGKVLPMLTGCSRNSKICMVFVFPFNSESGDIQYQLESVSPCQGASRYVVVKDCSEKSPQDMEDEQARVSSETKIPSNQILFLRNNANTGDDDKYLAVFDRIVVSEQPKPVSGKLVTFWFRPVACVVILLLAAIALTAYTGRQHYLIENASAFINNTYLTIHNVCVRLVGQFKLNVTQMWCF